MSTRIDAVLQNVMTLKQIDPQVLPAIYSWFQVQISRQRKVRQQQKRHKLERSYCFQVLPTPMEKQAVLEN